jgi:hypothetical protein
MPRDISNSEDIIDSRDIIARIEELEAEIEAEEISEDNGAEPQLDEDGNTKVETATCGTCGKSWNDALISSSTPTPGGRCPYEHIHDEIEELKVLHSLAEEASGYAADWSHGETLIRDSYFEDYAQQLAEDIGATNSEAAHQWPLTCIDWKQAARELQMDYTSVDYDGVTYWIR